MLFPTALVDHPAQCGCKAHDEDNRQTHTSSGVHLVGTAEERADAKELREDKVVDQDGT